MHGMCVGVDSCVFDFSLDILPSIIPNYFPILLYPHFVFVFYWCYIKFILLFISYLSIWRYQHQFNLYLRKFVFSAKWTLSEKALTINWIWHFLCVKIINSNSKIVVYNTTRSLESKGKQNHDIWIFFLIHTIIVGNNNNVFCWLLWNCFRFLSHNSNEHIQFDKMKMIWCDMTRFHSINEVIFLIILMRARAHALNIEYNYHSLRLLTYIFLFNMRFYAECMWSNFVNANDRMNESTFS